ncbi:type IV pilus modification PilV family protein [Desulfatitalea alkaliphila]|uniref:Prepilin-type N-terminal cleavage/methylation domain-containing protein n=1 Tax=Desulfatitalea alkaliphila TaxID=2929485 RepID=A0AA41R520_9BACT|nr:hypothetical protein [Desulfatitalea alkaliphila]MCJ8499373.1 hypothetical protein [Desulfatitalea alkaliphila]
MQKECPCDAGNQYTVGGRKAAAVCPARHPFSNRGFTLFEALAATMILAIALVTIMQLFSGGLRTGHLSEQYTRAVLCARQTMEELLLRPDSAEETLAGESSDGFRWQADITLADTDEDPPARAGELRLFHIALKVWWDDGQRQREVDLETVYLAKARDDS